MGGASVPGVTMLVVSTCFDITDRRTGCLKQDHLYIKLWLEFNMKIQHLKEQNTCSPLNIVALVDQTFHK